jgi:nitrogen-specific signal transduction histidine kinase
MNLDQNQLRKAMVSLVVEKVLRGIGQPIYEKAIKQLSKDYDCYLPECYEHPEYLNKVLKKIFGNAHMVIVDSIKKELDEYITEKPIEIFVTAISE